MKSREPSQDFLKLKSGHLKWRIIMIIERKKNVTIFFPVYLYLYPTQTIQLKLYNE